MIGKIGTMMVFASVILVSHSGKKSGVVVRILDSDRFLKKVCDTKVLCFVGFRSVFKKTKLRDMKILWLFGFWVLGSDRFLRRPRFVIRRFYVSLGFGFRSVSKKTVLSDMKVLYFCGF